MTKRRRFTADFKARVALDALRGDKTVQEIAARYKVHPPRHFAGRRYGKNLPLDLRPNDGGAVGLVNVPKVS